MADNFLRSPRRLGGLAAPVVLALFLLVVLHPWGSRGRGQHASGPAQAIPRGHELSSAASCSNVSYTPEGTGAAATAPSSTGPVVVDVGLFISAITSIDPVGNTFQVEGYLHTVWCDPRLAFDPAAKGVREEIFLEEKAREKLGEIWWPDLTFANEEGSRGTEDQQLILLADGTLQYQEKLDVVLEANFDLERFPFDEQVLEIEIESFAWDAEYLVLHKEDERIGFSDGFDLPEWRIERVETALEAVKEVRDRAPFSELLIEVHVSRQSGYYIWKVLIPLFLLVAVSWAVFWMPIEVVADRMSLSMTGLLTIVAYQFVISGGLPKVSYFTFMDSLLMVSFLLMILAIAENMTAHALHARGRTDLARKLDHACRWGFPLVLVLSIAVLALSYLGR